MGEICFKAESISTGYSPNLISNISFELHNGDIMGLIGRSGSGKTTILDTLTGLKKPNTGTISIRSKDSILAPGKAIGYSPQENALFPYLTLEENLLTFGKLNGIDEKEVKERALGLLKQLDLTEHKKKVIANFSGGMKKRADLAVTLIHDPEIIILDEPFVGLDISIRKFIWNLLAGLSRRGKIIIISSHILSDIQIYCNKFGLVYRGCYYGTEALLETLKKSNEKSLEYYLEFLFEKEIMD
jgi:ABC-2 type transport system ATP-binding protein